MDFTDHHTFDAPIDAVWAMFCDPASHVAKFESMGHRDIQVVESERADDSFRLVVRRLVDVDLPGFAKKVLKPTNTVTTTDTWQRDGDIYTGAQVVETAGAPVKISATTELAPDGRRTSYSATVHLEVKVPLIGGKLADWAKGMVSEQLVQEFAAGDRWLANPSSR
jgi:hypothetical protein